MSVEVSQRARQGQRPLLTGLAGAGTLTGVVLLVWQVPTALSPISSRRYAAAVKIGTRVVLVVAAVVLVGAVLDRARQRRWWAAATLAVLVGLTTVVLLVWLAPPARYKNITPDKDHASILAGPAASTGVSRGPAVDDDVLLTIRASAAGKAARARRSDPSVAE